MNDIILRIYLLFEGRMNRLTFFTGTTVLFFAANLAGFIFTGLKVKMQLNEEQGMYLSLLIAAVFLLLWSVPIVRRLHDLDMPGKNITRITVPGYNIYFLFVLLLTKGTDGSNQYGADSVLPRVK